MAPVKARLAGNGYPPAKSRNAGTRHAPCLQPIVFQRGAAVCAPAGCVIDICCGECVLQQHFDILLQAHTRHLKPMCLVAGLVVLSYNPE